MNIAICDSEKNTSNYVYNIIKKHLLNKKIKYSITIYHSATELLYEKKTFDIILSDIYVNGIDVATHIRQRDKNVKIIFITKSMKHKDYAFAVHAFAYLNKPIDSKQLCKQLDDAINYSRYSLLPDYIEFINSDNLLKINPLDIYYFEYYNRKIKLVTKNKIFYFKEKISKVLEIMGEYNFDMPHKSFIVNFYHIRYIKGYIIYIDDGTMIPLSQKRSTSFKKRFNNFLINNR